MPFQKSISLVAAGLVLCALCYAQHQAATAMEPGHVMFDGQSFDWQPGPKSLPAGAEAVVLEGDPTKEGPFTMRVKVPANYTIAPHWHPADEHVTVISGTFYMAPTETLDRSMAKGMSAGGFALMKAGQRHFAFTGEDGAVIQLHGEGPWGITYINPEDDPRKPGR